MQEYKGFRTLPRVVHRQFHAPFTVPMLKLCMAPSPCGNRPKRMNAIGGEQWTFLVTRLRFGMRPKAVVPAGEAMVGMGSVRL